MTYNGKEPEYKLNPYENIDISGLTIYHDINSLISDNENIKTESNIIINLLNGTSGMGSQLSLIMQNMYYFKEMNPNIICLPHFSKNNDHFKYHNPKYFNSFFLYFKRKENILDISNYKQYCLQLGIIDSYPFFNPIAPIMQSEPNNKYITNFNKEYDFIRLPEIVDNINRLKKEKPLIGLHMRSYVQKKIHQDSYITISIKDRLTKVKEKLDSENKDYSIFLATDVVTYIDIAKTIFNNDIYYFDNITRMVDDNEDVITQLTDDQAGYKLGSDILNECLALSMCNKVYLSFSNTMYTVSLFNPDVIMEEY